ncbi:MAG: DUF1488 family protein [Alphaproteobacteria bacterium]
MALSLLTMDAAYYPQRESVRFFAADGFETMLCMVSVEALRAHFGLTNGDSSAAIRLAETCRDRIEQIARNKYEARAIWPERAIVLQASDFTGEARAP